MKDRLKRKQILSVMLSVAMINTAMPMNAFAAESTEDGEEYVHEYTLEESEDDGYSIEETIADESDIDTSSEETEMEQESIESETVIDSDENVLQEEDIIDGDEYATDDEFTTEETEKTVEYDISIMKNYTMSTEELKIQSIKQTTATKVTITWNAIDGASSYAIYRMEEGDTAFKRIKKVTTIESYNSGLEEGITYYYKVEALDSSSNVIASSDVAEITINGVNSTAPIIKIQSIVRTSTTKVTITWNAIDGASNYAIYRMEEGDTTFKKIKKVTTIESYNSGLEEGITYYYKVEALDSNGKVISSSEAEGITIPIALSEPRNVVVKQVANSGSTVDISWDAVEKADGYALYRSVDGGEFKKVKNVTGTSTKNYNLALGSTYVYKVQAYYKDNSETVYGNFSDEVKISLIDMAAPVITNITQKTATTAVITWGEVKNADGYKLYRSTSLNGTYSAIKSVTTTTTENYNLTNGTTYYYKVCAFMKDSNGEVVYSDYSKQVSIKILSTPSISSISQTDENAVTLKWNKVSGASGYILYRSDTSDGNYLPVNTEIIKSNTIQDSGLVEGRTYYYKLTACANSDGVYRESVQSAVKYITVLGVPIITDIEELSSSSVKITWTPVENATGYKLYRSEEEEGTYKCIKNITSGTSVGNYSLTEEQCYYYKVAAYIVENSTTHIGLQSDAKDITLGDDTSNSGSIGDVNWTLKRGVLTFSGEGSIDTTFQADTTITKVVIGSGITEIEDKAFQNCISLQTLEIEDGLTRIGNNAFENCINLTNISIPETVTSISINTFKGIGATTVGPIGGGYDYEYGWTTTIPDYAFSNMTKLATATISGVTGVAKMAFYGDTSLENIIVEKMVNIDRYSFSRCDNLKNVTIGDGVETICNYAFQNKKSIETVTIGDSVTTIGDYAFQNCTSLKTVTMGDNIKKIGKAAFYNCSALSISLSSGISIGDNAFVGCKNVVIDNGQ